MVNKKSATLFRSNAAAVLSGLIVSQVVAAIAVFLSNGSIHQTAAAINGAGWLAVPAGPVLEALTTSGAAFRGGVFFTLSIGAGLTLFTWAVVQIWRFFLPHNRRWPYGVLALALILVAAVNIKGWVWFPSILVAATILTTGFVAGSTPPPARRPITWWRPVLVLAVLTGMWATQFNEALFITIRDHILLSNLVGSRINDFYYRNTLYAAEIFKSFNQKTLRTNRIEGIEDPALIHRLTTMLADRDVLTVPEASSVDVVISLSRGEKSQNGSLTGLSQFSLTAGNGRGIVTSLAALTADPGLWLKKMSDASDRFALFRKMTFLGLLVGFPVLLYISVYGLMYLISRRFMIHNLAVWFASALCLVVGILLFKPVLSERPLEIQPRDINEVLQNGPWTRRVAALQRIEEDKLDIVKYPAYRPLLRRGTDVERYYLARVMALSRSTSTYSDLLSMMDDPHPNVVCQVYYALGKRKDPSAIPLIKDRILQSDHWYTQWYGYRAMRSLGWHQTRSE